MRKKTWAVSQLILNKLTFPPWDLVYFLAKWKTDTSPRWLQELLEKNCQGNFSVRVGLQWEQTTGTAPVGTGCWEAPRPLSTRQGLQLGLWRSKAITSDLPGGQSNEKLGTAWSIVQHSRISQLIAYLFIYLATWCQNLACGSHLGHFLSLGSALPDFRALLTWHLKRVAIILS